MSLEGKCSMEKADLSLNKNYYKLCCHLQLSFYLNQGNKYMSYLHVNACNLVKINVFYYLKLFPCFVIICYLTFIYRNKSPLYQSHS